VDLSKQRRDATLERLYFAELLEDNPVGSQDHYFKWRFENRPKMAEYGDEEALENQADE